VLPPDEVTIGAGFSSQFRVGPAISEADPVAERVLDEAAFSPGLAPWVAARMGLDSDFEVGLTYTGRTARLDLRHAFDLGAPTLSIGLGASGLLPKRHDDLGFRVSGAGGDLPILLGLRSSGDVFAGWIGARGGFEILDGSHDLPSGPDTAVLAPVTEDVKGWRTFAGGLVGLRVGFRHIFGAIELDGAMHWAKGTVGPTEVSFHQFALSPAGALIGQF